MPRWRSSLVSSSRGRYGTEPISIFLTLRRVGPIDKVEDLLEHYEMMRIKGEELAANAKSRFFSTVITSECKMVIKASNLKDGSVTTRNVEGALTQTVFWFDHDDVRKMVGLVLKDGFDRFVNDTKIEDGTIKSVR